MARAIDVVQVKAEIAAEKLAVIIENGSVLLKDMQSGEAVKIATLTTPNDPADSQRSGRRLFHGKCAGGSPERDGKGLWDGWRFYGGAAGDGWGASLHDFPLRHWESMRSLGISWDAKMGCCIADLWLRMVKL